MYQPVSVRFLREAKKREPAPGRKGIHIARNISAHHHYGRYYRRDERHYIRLNKEETALRNELDSFQLARGDPQNLRLDAS